MKKFLGTLIITAVLMTMMVTAVSAAPTILWDFGADSDIESVMDGANVLSYYGEDFYHVFEASGNDPYVSMRIGADDVSQVLWAKARVKNPSPATAIEFFGATNGRALTGSECTHIDIEPNSEEWKTYIIYIPDANVTTVNAYKDPQYAISDFYWQGTVEYIRLDPMWQEGDDGSDSGGNMSSGDTIMIDYVAFFPTEEEAKAYMSENEKAEAEAAAPVEDTTAAPAETEAPATDAPVVDTAPAPQTADVVSLAAAAAVLSLAAAYAVIKNKSRKQ